jgi:dipeptidase E
MKLVLASAGFYTQEIVNKTVELVGKPIEEIKVAVINEAYAVGHGNHWWVLDDLNRIQANFPSGFELVNLLALDIDMVKSRLELADVIFVVGGHTDYLMYVFNKTGFSKILPELLKTKVYVGSSAGSMVLAQRVSTAAYTKVYGEENDYGVTEYMNLVDFALKPHLNNPLFPNNNKEVLLEVSKDFVGTLYGLHDDSAIIIEGESQYAVGTQPIVIKDGKIVQLPE